MKDGTVYSRRRNFCPFSTSALESYAGIVGEERIERLQKVAEQLKGAKLLEINATAQGGGVAEMLYSSIPFLNSLGIEAEWKIVHGNEEYFEVTKQLHNLLQGGKGSLTSAMEQTYFRALEDCAKNNPLDYSPDVLIVNDPQPLGLVHYLKEPSETRLWRCHIDIEETALRANPRLWDFTTTWVGNYDAGIFGSSGGSVLP